MTTKVKTGATTGVTSPVEANVTVSASALINGEQRSSGQTLEIRDPYRGDVVGTMDISSTADLDDALAEIVSELVPGARLSVGPGKYRHGNVVELVRKGAFDISRAESEFGWKPKYDIRSGLAAYIDAMRARREGK